MVDVHQLYPPPLLEQTDAPAPTPFSRSTMHERPRARATTQRVVPTSRAARATDPRIHGHRAISAAQCQIRGHHTPCAPPASRREPNNTAPSSAAPHQVRGHHAPSAPLTRPRDRVVPKTPRAGRRRTELPTIA
ncbi:hypothetical protein ZWY2020_017982 [Hordeum vulgare]|nr:hypothetical protein ZWY2020_017982 [Hordeum vulgare]